MSKGEAMAGRGVGAINKAHQQAFVELFEVLASKGAEGDAARAGEWQAVAGTNGHASLAEVDGWIQARLADTYDSRAASRAHHRFYGLGDELWKWYRAVFIIAFQDAADSTADEQVKGTKASTTMDYVQRAEFRLLCAYLVVYCRILDCFRIAGGGDKRISLRELREGYRALVVESHDFVGLRLGNGKTVESMFSAMDEDGKGVVTLTEWCHYMEEAEVHGKTELGAILSEGDANARLSRKDAMAGREAVDIEQAKRIDAASGYGYVNAPWQDAFVAIFRGLSLRTADSQRARDETWVRLDPNKNGHASLAEVGHIRAVN
jgi:hypothetical protein